MLTDAAFVLIGAVTLGVLLAVVQLQALGKPPIPWPVAMLHGVTGAAGLVMVLAAPAGARGVETGTTGFRAIAVVLLVIALLVGGLILRARVARRRLSFTLVGVHALLAISGVVMLGAYLAAG
ncbi:MAG TPA: hypothetical protein VIZ17_07310 [Acetobacteraceae bacterium]